MSTIARDIGDRERLELSLRHQALHDALTGLPNRALLDDRVSHAWPPGASTAAVLFLDLDRFKVVNDAEGHAAGDAVLVEVAAGCAPRCGREDTVARFGGDEFVVLCETGGLDAAEQVAARLQASLGRPFDTGGPPRFLGRQHRHRAGAAGQHRRRTCCGTPTPRCTGPRTSVAVARRCSTRRSGRRASARLEVTTALRRALDEGELRLHYQPIVALADERLLGFEALVRWQHPERGLLGPARLHPGRGGDRADRPAGRVGPADRPRAGRRAGRAGAAPARRAMSVNVSARQLEEPGPRRGDRRRALEAHRVPRRRR